MNLFPNQTISNFTNSSRYNSLIQSALKGSAKSISINSSNIPINNGQIVKKNSPISNYISDLDKNINIKQYTTPTKHALESFKKAGDDIDKALSESFLLQLFDIKGTDILCSSFCFLLSLLPCNVRNELYDALYNTDKAVQTVNIGLRATNEIMQSVQVGVSSMEGIARTSKDIFNGNAKNKNIGEQISTYAVAAAVPLSIINNIQLVKDALTLGLEYKVEMPQINKTMWDISDNVIGIVQTMVIQAADEMMTKLIAPLENMIKDIIPAACFGNQSIRLFSAIIDTIRKIKSKLLKELADLISTNKDFTDKIKKQTKKSSTALELIAFGEALRLISADFFNIARACGVTRCTGTAINVNDLLRSDIGNLNSGANYFNYKYNNPTDLNKLGNISFSDNEIMSSFSIAKNAPAKIRELINNKLLDSILDNNYNIFDDGKDITVVYNSKKNCGE